MIVIIVIRRCFCEVCNRTFDLEWREDPPEKCKVCGSLNWEEAPEVRDAIYLRKGITKKQRRINPGAEVEEAAGPGETAIAEVPPET